MKTLQINYHHIRRWCYGVHGKALDWNLKEYFAVGVWFYLISAGGMNTSPVVTINCSLPYLCMVITSFDFHPCVLHYCSHKATGFSTARQTYASTNDERKNASWKVQWRAELGNHHIKMLFLGNTFTFYLSILPFQMMIPQLWLLAKQKTWKAGIPRYIPNSGVYFLNEFLKKR